MIKIIIGYIGTRGRGKTLSCVREAHEHYKKGYKIYSNIKLNRKIFPSYEMVSLKQIVDWVKGDVQLKKAVLILDEVHVYIDSRSGMSKKNVILSYFVLQTRKRDVRLLYTTQFIDQVDKRLRQPTEVMIQCQNYDTGHRYDKKNNEIQQRNIVWHKETGRTWVDPFCANDYYGHYDTNEIVNPFKD